MASGAGTTPSRSGRHTTVHVAGGARYSTDETQPWTTYLSLLALYTAAIMVTVVGLWLYNTLGRPPPPGPKGPYRSYPFKLSASGYTQLLGCIHLNQQIEAQQKNESTAAAAPGPAASAAQQPQEGKQLAPQQVQGALPRERIICTDKGCFPEAQVNKPQVSPTPSTSTSTSIPSAQQQTQQTATPATTTPTTGSTPNSQLVFPEKFSYLKPTEPLPVDMLPVPLANFYSGPKPKEAVVKFHWVITSCERNGWGRYLTSTILSGVFNGLFPATISLVWCNQYVPGEVPSILYNLRHSHSINIFFMSPKMHALKRPSTHKIYLSAMMVPTMLQKENLDLLITEDDILFAPDANARIASALSQYQRAANEPSLLYLYQSVNEPKLAHQAWEQAEDDAGNANLAHTGRVDQVNPWYTFGTQAILTNPQMTAILVRQILQVVQQGMLEDLLQDLMSRHWVLDVWKCNTPGSHCTYALALPCVVQHVGTSSAIFNNAGGLNKRFHSATNFPVRVQFPGFEDGW